MSENDVRFHYFDHVTNRGLVDAFYTVVRITFRISLLIHDVNEDVVKELTRIPTLLRISYLHNDKMYFYIAGQNYMFVKITEFINTLIM
ncbi:hypothetical protein [Saccharolobus islandicus]|uniref:hypothetical protein n=1 Tax=Saccharolobus islandicus TaxID=43080 RepID=UPI001CEF9F3B|nr:hypothetical protein [Sulfolobus islandicus]